jgi:biopolymer transport protein ExbD
VSASAAEFDDGTVTGINVTPLVDIMMVLLIIFMVAAKITSESELKVQLPKTAAASPASARSLTVTLASDGSMKLMSADVDMNGLLATLEREAKANPGVRVSVAADEALPYKRVVEVLGAIQKAGVVRVGLAAERTGA